MAKPRDILLDANFDLRIENGDFVIGESTAQHQQLLLMLNKGELKQYPTATVGAILYKNDEGPSEFIQEIATKFSQDGMNVNKIAVEMGIIKIDAEY